MLYYVVSSRERITKVELLSWDSNTRTLTWEYDGKVESYTLEDLDRPFGINKIKFTPTIILYYVSGVFETLDEAKGHALSNLQKEIDVAKPYLDEKSVRATYVRSVERNVKSLLKQIEDIRKKLLL